MIVAERRFLHEQAPSRVLFGVGRVAELADEIESLGAQRALLLTTPQQADQAAGVVRGRTRLLVAGTFGEAVMHVPTEIAKEAVSAARAAHADLLLPVGGGSTIGLAKAIALEIDLPILAVPTTYAGSEMTPIFGLTEHQVKRTGRNVRVLPRTVIYDPELTVSLPPAMSVTSGINAIAHCVEALYAPEADPLVALLAEEGIRVLALSLPRIAKNPADLGARSDALYGAWLAGRALGSVSMSLHHKLCHTLGGTFNLPHAETHCAVLPYAFAFNAPFAPDAERAVARALGGEPAALHLLEFVRGVGAPSTLRELGLTSGDLDRAADLAVERPYANPRPITRAAIRALLEDAYRGRIENAS